MSKKKTTNNNTKPAVKAEEVKETPVVTEEVKVEEPTTVADEPVIDEVDTMISTPEETAAKEPDPEPATDDSTVIEEPKVGEEDVKNDNVEGDKKAEDSIDGDKTDSESDKVDQVPEVKADGEDTTENGSDKGSTDVDTTESNDEPVIETNKNIFTELNKVYNCRFSMSSNTKAIAVRREISLYNMIDLFVKFRTSFIGMTNLKEFEHVKSVIMNNEFNYNSKPFTKESKLQFLDQIGDFTNYACSHWNED